MSETVTSGTDIYRHRLCAKALLFGQDWDEATEIVENKRHRFETKHAAEGAWIESLEYFGPLSSKPWIDDDEDSREPEWGSGIQRFQATLHIIIRTTGFEETQEFIDKSVDWEEAHEETENFYVRGVVNLGRISESDTGHGGFDE